MVVSAPTETHAHGRRGRPRDPRREAAIYDAALELLAEVGYDRMTVDAVAARAGVSKPTIYRRCPDGKAQLVTEAIRVRRAEHPPVPDTGALRTDLLAAVREACAKTKEHARLAAGIVSVLRESEEFAAIFREHIATAEQEKWQELVDRAVARGELDPRSVSPLFADVAPSLIHTRALYTDDPLGEAFAIELVDRILLPILRTGKKSS
jgi:AcrR family transcriptional regulator